MTEDLRSALREIADVRAGHAGHLGPPNPDDLWQLGTRRRRRGRAMLAAGAVVAAGLLAGLAGLWNVAPQGDPFSPAGGGNSTATLSSYPEYVAKPLRIKDISEAPGRKTAVISSSDTTVLYAVAPDGAVSKVSPEDEFGQGVAALSPDGRYLSYGFHLVDLVSGIPVDNDDASRLSMQRKRPGEGALEPEGDPVPCLPTGQRQVGGKQGRPEEGLDPLHRQLRVDAAVGVATLDRRGHVRVSAGCSWPGAVRAGRQ